MPYRAIPESMLGVILAWLISTAWGNSLIAVLGDISSSGALQVPNALNAMGEIDKLDFVTTEMKQLLLFVGLVLWVAMTAAVVYRGFAGGWKLYQEGNAKKIEAQALLAAAETARCKYPECPYFAD
jgi:hypothetical protein